MRKSLRGVTIAGVLATCTIAILTLIPETTSAAPGGQPCGGITGAPCPEGFVCKDVPGDGCNPNQGGADCPGVCKRVH
jgi:hypothetical protein